MPFVATVTERRPQWRRRHRARGMRFSVAPHHAAQARLVEYLEYCRYLEHGGALPITLSSQTDAPATVQAKSANARIADDTHGELGMSREATAGAAAKSQTEELAAFHQRQVRRGRSA